MYGSKSKQADKPARLADRQKTLEPPAAPPGNFRPNVSVFIMTKDEEVNITRCLESVRWSNDVVVLDAFSEDRTLQIAGEFQNVRVFQRRFTDYADQRNHGLTRIEYLNPWTLVLDADEVVEPALADEILDIARRARCAEPQPSAYMVRRRPVLGGRALSHNFTASCWIARLLRTGLVHYEGRVHERVVVDGMLGKLEGMIEHHQFAKGMDDWMRRRLLYAQLEMEMREAGEFPDVPLRNIFSTDPLKRRALLKACFVRMPCRWLIYFSYNFVISGAWRDGYLGIKYVHLEAQSIRRSDLLKRSLHSRSLPC